MILVIIFLQFFVNQLIILIIESSYIIKKNYIFLSLVLILVVYKSHSQTLSNLTITEPRQTFGPENFLASENSNYIEYNIANNNAEGRDTSGKRFIPENTHHFDLE